ncbi:thioredoxin [Thiocapsa imhoffii]|uniref:Thioredoxin n=1 Tax=Thiocapsa imhoffii TaxID=382777 RepID=A0A9X1B7G8_9GAMM|nr:thioredoxin fold domain-containing protein [Thiocapsa imhoffii]MBK1643834.1 thioredoxin [Thiocapsa imhoffii]
MLSSQPRRLRKFVLITIIAALSVPWLAQAEEVVTPGQLIGVKALSHPDWFKNSFLDLAEDVEEAAAQGKHVILIMEMEGCPYCYKMIQENFANAPYRDFIQEHFDVIALDTKGDRKVAVTAEMSMTEKEMAELYQVRFTPTLIFLDPDNRPVARITGYRHLDDFKLVLDYVQERAYTQQDFNQYALARRDADLYQFRAHPHIQDLDDLSQVEDTPLAILFEDGGCVACDALHDGHLADPHIRELLEGFTLVRLDTRSEAPLIDVRGKTTTPKAFAEALGIHYRPSIVFFDAGSEVTRIEGDLYRFHFGGFLEYVAGRHAESFPDSPFDYINAKAAELMAAGQDVFITDD